MKTSPFHLTVVIAVIAISVFAQSPSPTPTATPSPTPVPVAPAPTPTPGTVAVPLKPQTISLGDALLLQAAMENAYRADGSRILNVAPGTMQALHFDLSGTTGYRISGAIISGTSH